MRILLFTLEYPPFRGGVANYYGNLARFWPEKNGLFVLHNNDNKLLKPHWLFAIFKLWREIKNKKINHVIVGHILPLGTITYFLSKFTKTKYSVILHGMDFTFAMRKARKKRLAKKILSQAKNIICSNSYTAGLVKDFLEDKYADKIHVVNPGIDISHNPASHNSKLATRSFELKEKYNLQDKIVLFSVGRLVKRKGFDMVARAMPEVVRSVPNLYYFMAGDGPDKKYIYNLAKGAPNIVFLGKISEEDKWAWLNLCDIFIMPSRVLKDLKEAELLRLPDGNRRSSASSADFEGFGIVYLEANICGKPVIAGDSGGVGDAVKNAITGILVDPQNIERIANTIITLAKNEPLRKKLGEQGRARALKEFKWEDKVREIYEIIFNF